MTEPNQANAESALLYEKQGGVATLTLSPASSHHMETTPPSASTQHSQPPTPYGMLGLTR